MKNYLEYAKKEKILEKLSDIKLLVLDVDGILTDCKIHVLENGFMKSFNALDGMGIKLLQKIGVEIALITLSKSIGIIKKRCADLGIKEFIAGESNKKQSLEKLLEKLNISQKNCAFMGDDIIDLGAMSISKVAISVPNAHYFVQNKSDYITFNDGGDGAVREVCDLILHSKGKFEEVYESYISQ